MILAATHTELSTLLNDELIAIILFVFMYLLYYFGSGFKWVKAYLKRYHETEDHYEQSVYFRRTMGFILLGVIPFLVTLFFFHESILFYGVGLPTGEGVLLWVFIPIIVIGVGSVLRSSKTIDTSYYPEVRVKQWTKKRTFLNAAFWGLYLLGYEFAIRGMLFFTSIYAFGLWPAIIINSAIYSFIHIFKGKQEAFGAFFLGILFCLITYYTQSFWPVFICHVLLAVINDLKAIKVSKKMNEQFSK